MNPQMYTNRSMKIYMELHGFEVLESDWRNFHGDFSPLKLMTNIEVSKPLNLGNSLAFGKSIVHMLGFGVLLTSDVEVANELKVM